MNKNTKCMLIQEYKKIISQLEYDLKKYKRKLKELEKK